MKAISVMPLPNYQLEVSFDDRVSGMIDLKNLLHTKVFADLSNVALFNEVQYNNSAIYWNNEMEIDLLNVYMQLYNKTPDDFFGDFEYASN